MCDQMESQAEEMSCRQIEHDMKEFYRQIEDILYCVSMESSLSIEELKLLCRVAGVQFPPQKQEQV